MRGLDSKLSKMHVILIRDLFTPQQEIYIRIKI